MRTLVLLAAAAILCATGTRAADPPKAKEKETAFEFTGRLAPTEQVEVRTRVTGFLDKVLVEEGDAVKEGQLLAELDPRPYKGQFDLAAAKLAQAQARRKVKEANLARLKKLFENGGVPKEEYDTSAAELDEARAEVEVNKATVDIARLTLAYTKVVSPIAGRVLRRKATAGNLAAADTDILFTVAPTDPLTVEFEMDERAALQFQKRLNPNSKFTVAVGFADDKGFPHTAEFKLLGSRVDPVAGTLTAKAALPNPKGRYLPGMFVRVRLTHVADK